MTVHAGRARHRKSTSRRLTAALAVLLIAPTVGIELLTEVAAGAGITTFTGSGQVSHPDGIVAGPDGALWFTEASDNRIGRIATNGTVQFFSDATISQPRDITLGPDDNM